MRRLWARCADERGMTLVVAIFVMAILLVSGVFFARMTATENDIAYGSVWGEGSFFAADAAVNVALDQIAPTLSTSTIALSSLDSRFTYEGTIAMSGTGQQPGYALNAGTGYNAGGHVFYNFTVTGTGYGPRSAQRILDVQASYGPVAQ